MQIKYKLFSLSLLFACTLGLASEPVQKGCAFLPSSDDTASTKAWATNMARTLTKDQKIALIHELKSQKTHQGQVENTCVSLPSGDGVVAKSWASRFVPALSVKQKIALSLAVIGSVLYFNMEGHLPLSYRFEGLFEAILLGRWFDILHAWRYGPGVFSWS